MSNHKLTVDWKFAEARKLVCPLYSRKLRIPKTGMGVILAHQKNPDIVGGYWEEPVDKGKPVYCGVHTLQHAAAEVRDYIGRNGLGIGNWVGASGAVLLNGQPVAYISYNGWVWGADGNEITELTRKEITQASK